MALEKVRVGFIGAGSHATKVHYPSLAEMEDVELAAVCDLVESRRNEVARKFGAKAAYGDFRRMLDGEKPDAVYAVLPPQDLYPVAAEVLRRETPLFVEKPPGLTSYQAGCLAAIAEEHSTMSLVGFNRRHAPLLVRARELVEEDGPVDHFVVTFCKHAGPAARPYYDGAIDVLMCDAIHAVDMLRFLGGEAEAVAAVTRISHGDQDEKYVALVRFRGGRTGFLNCCWNSGRRMLSAELHGGGSCAFLEIENEMRFYRAGGEALVMTAAEVARSDSMHRTRGYFQENRHFIDCVKSGRSPENDLADSFKTMVLAERICSQSI